MSAPQQRPSPATENPGLEEFRDQLAQRLLRVLQVIGLLALLGSLARALDSGWRPLLALHVGLSLVVLLAALFATRLNPLAKRLLLLGILLVLGMAGIAALGLLSHGPVVFVALGVLAAALLGTRAALAAIAVSVLIIAAAGALAATGGLRFAIDPAAYLYSATAWISSVTSTLLAAGLAVTATGFLVRALENRHAAQRRTTGILDAITRNSPDILLLLDVSGKIMYLSHTEAGYHDGAVFVGQPMFAFAIPEHRRRLQAAIEQVAETGVKQRVEATYADPAGRHHPYDIHLAPVLQDGRVTALSVIARDIDTQRHTENALRSARDFNTAVLDTIGALVVVLDHDGHILRFNPACEQASGCPARDALGRRIWEFLVAPDDRPAEQAVFASLAAGHFPNFHENDWVARDGTRRRIAWSNTALAGPDGRVTHVIATGIDISRWVEAEAARARSEERLRLSQRYANIGTWDWNIRTGAVLWSEQIGPLFGYGREIPEITYENFLKSIHPDDRQRVIADINANVQHGARYFVEHRVVWPDGSERWLLGSGDTTRDADGRPLNMLGVVQDITDRKQAETALAESEQLFREFAENIEEVFWVRDLRSNCMIYVNPAYEKIWGQSCAALLANPLDFLETVHPDDLPRVQEGLLLQQQGHDYFNRRYRIVRPDGELRWVHAQTFPIRDASGTVYRIGGFVRDITRQQLADSENLERERTQLLALVREVHHRIKNHLQGVIGLLHTGIDSAPEAAAALREAASQVRSIALVHGLQGQNARAELHLCEMVPAIVTALRETLPDPVPIDLDVDMNWSLRIAEEDAVPLALVIHELLVNGAKHLPAAARRSPLTLTLHERDRVGCLTLVCPGARLPAHVDFAAGHGLGTGLELVRALLPRQGASLTILNSPAGVRCELILRAPVVQAGSRPPTTGRPDPSGNDHAGPGTPWRRG